MELIQSTTKARVAKKRKPLVRTDEREDAGKFITGRHSIFEEIYAPDGMLP